MTGKERIKAAMDLKPVDQVPFMCQMSIGHMLLQLDVSPLEFWFDKDVYINGLIKLREQYNFDGILVSLYGHDPNWRDAIIKITQTDDFEIGEFENGDKIYCPYNELPFYEFVKVAKPLTLDDFKVEDLDSELSYFPVSKNLPFNINRKHTVDVLEDIIKSEGDQFSIHGEITSPFDYYLDYFGHQEGLIGLFNYPEKVKLFLRHYTNLLKDLATKMWLTGVDAIKISSPFASAAFISPTDYLEFIYPFEKEIVQTIRKNNVHTYIHTCGPINDRLELIYKTGASGIECLDPAPLGNVDLADAKKRIGSKGFIKGNIDSVNILLNSTPEEIYSDVKDRIEIGSKNSGFILSTACSIAPNVKKENIQLVNRIIADMK